MTTLPPIPKHVDITFSSCDGVVLGTAHFILYKNTPLTSYAFGALCTPLDTALTHKTDPHTKLSYQHTIIHLNTPAAYMTCGDIQHGRIDPTTNVLLAHPVDGAYVTPGRGRLSVFGGTFEDENFHNEPHFYSLCTAHPTGPTPPPPDSDTPYALPKNASSQFIITTNQQAHLFGKHCIFGGITPFDREKAEKTQNLLRYMNQEFYSTEDVDYYEIKHGDGEMPKFTTIYISACEVVDYWSYEELLTPGKCWHGFVYQMWKKNKCITLLLCEYDDESDHHYC